MRVIVAGEQISFFERFGYVELEAFFSEKEVSSLLAAVEEEVESRKQKFSLGKVDDPYLLHGFDLALSSESVRKEVFSQKLAKAAFELVRKKPLRYAFDWVWKIPGLSLSSPLESISSVTPVVMSVLIALEAQADVTLPASIPFEYTSFPQGKGSVAFIAPKTVVTTSSVMRGKYLVVAYSSAVPIYRLQPQDPHTHFLKQYGYVFGDRLKETTHPVLFR